MAFSPRDLNREHFELMQNGAVVLNWSRKHFEQRASRDALLVGSRLIALVHTDDPAYVRRDICGTHAQCNPADWTSAARGL